MFFYLHFVVYQTVYQTYFLLTSWIVYLKLSTIFNATYSFHNSEIFSIRASGSINFLMNSIKTTNNSKKFDIFWNVYDHCIIPKIVLYKYVNLFRKFSIQFKDNVIYTKYKVIYTKEKVINDKTYATFVKSRSN